MLVLLDESLPRHLVRELDGFEVKTVTQMGWAGTKNGALLKLARQSGFSVLVTADQNLEYQQNIPNSDMSILVIKAFSTRIEDLLPLVSKIRRGLMRIKPGQVLRVNQQSA